MDWKYLIPIIGVAVGWLLNELSTHFRVRDAERRPLGRAIVTLLYLRHESIRLTAILDIFKDTHSTEEYEKFRQACYERYTLPDEITSKSLDSAIETVANVSPMLAIQLKKAKEAYLFGKKIKLDHSSGNKDKYLRFLSVNEVMTDLNIKDIEDVIRKLAFKHGLLTYWRVRKMLTNLESERNKMISTVSVALRATEETENAQPTKESQPT